MIRKTRHVSSVVKSGGAAKRLSFKGFRIMVAGPAEGNASPPRNPRPARGVNGLEEEKETMGSVSPAGRLAAAW
jgi:hypothetical protein